MYQHNAGKSIFATNNRNNNNNNVLRHYSNNFKLKHYVLLNSRKDQYANICTDYYILNLIWHVTITA